jgi:chromosome segregation and condensation protein ScpB
MKMRKVLNALKSDAYKIETLENQIDEISKQKLKIMVARNGEPYKIEKVQKEYERRERVLLDQNEYWRARTKMLINDFSGTVKNQSTDLSSSSVSLTSQQ